MTKLVWDAVGERRYETGVDRGVLYPKGVSGVAWNGLVGVSENPTGGDPTPYYQDGVKFRNDATPEDFEGTIEAFTYPNEFAACDGTINDRQGLQVTNQPRRSFGLTYRTKVGNDLKGIDHAYKIHLIYNALAAPADRSNQTIGEDVEAMTFSWNFTTTPVFLQGRRPTAHLIIDSATTNPELLSELEDILYGSETTQPTLPTPAELVDLFDRFLDFEQKISLLGTDSIAFLHYLQDPRTTMGIDLYLAYGETYTGEVEGTVTDMVGPITSLPHVAMDPAFDYYYYFGKAHGTWSGVTPFEDYEVHITVERTYEPYFQFQGAFPLNEDGTWSTGEETIGEGHKRLQVIRVADGEVAISEKGPIQSSFDDVEVRLYSGADSETLMDTVSLSGDGRFVGNVAEPGKIAARLYRISTGETLAATDWVEQKLPRSFEVETDDPVYSQDLLNRGNTSDSAIVAMTFLDYGENERAERILTTLSELQNSSGSWNVAYDVQTHKTLDLRVRTDVVAWVALAALHYKQLTDSDRYQPMVIAAADYLISQQVSDGVASAGLVRQGSGDYVNDAFEDVPMESLDTDNNVLAWFVFRDIYARTADERFNTARERVELAILGALWNASEERLISGFENLSETLVNSSLGGMFLLAVNDYPKASNMLTHMGRYRVIEQSVDLNPDPAHWNGHYENPGPLVGYKPYSLGYENPPELIWAEGTWSAILFKKRMGLDVTSDLRAMLELAETTGEWGKWIQSTYTQEPWPYIFQTWPAASSAAWAALVLKEAPGVLSLFAPPLIELPPVVEPETPPVTEEPPVAEVETFTLLASADVLPFAVGVNPSMPTVCVLDDDTVLIAYQDLTNNPITITHRNKDLTIIETLVVPYPHTMQNRGLMLFPRGNNSATLALNTHTFVISTNPLVANAGPDTIDLHWSGASASSAILEDGTAVQTHYRGGVAIHKDGVITTHNVPTGGSETVSVLPDGTSVLVGDGSNWAGVDIYRLDPATGVSTHVETVAPTVDRFSWQGTGGPGYFAALETDADWTNSSLKLFASDGTLVTDTQWPGPTYHQATLYSGSAAHPTEGLISAWATYEQKYISATSSYHYGDAHVAAAHIKTGSLEMVELPLSVTFGVAGTSYAMAPVVSANDRIAVIAVMLYKNGDAISAEEPNQYGVTAWTIELKGSGEGTSSDSPSGETPTTEPEASTFTVTDNGDGTWTATGSDEEVSQPTQDTYQINHSSAQDNGDGTHTVG